MLCLGLLMSAHRARTYAREGLAQMYPVVEAMSLLNQLFCVVPWLFAKHSPGQ